MRKLFTFLLLALIATKIALIIARGPTEIEMDAFGYWRLSNHVLSGDVLMFDEPIAYRTPMYPWFLSAVRAVSPQPLLTIVAIQGAMAMSSIIIAAFITARICKDPAAINFTLAASLPMMSSYVFAAATLTETLFTFLLMVHLLSVLDYAKYDSVKGLVWLAFTFALVLLTRPIVMLLWLPHMVFVLMIHRRRYKRLGKRPGRVQLHHRVVHAAIGAGVIFVMAAPWMARNYSMFDKPFLTEFVGRNLWIVTFRDGSGTGLELPDTTESKELQRRLDNVGETNWQDTWFVSRALTKSGLNDAQSDALMKKVAFQAVAADQNPFAWKAFRRCVNYWRCTATDLWEQGNPDGNYRGEKIWSAKVPVIDWLLERRFSLSLIGNTVLMVVIGVATLFLVFQKTSRPYAVWIAMILGYFAVVTGVLEIPDYRYRMVVEPIAVIPIGAACAMLFAAKKAKKHAKAMA